MASYRKRGKIWRAEIYRDGQRESSSFPNKAEAVAWATQREHDLIGGRLPEHTVLEALRRYSREVSPTHKGEQWEIARLGLLERDPLAKLRMDKLKASDLAAWRDRRLKGAIGVKAVSGASVAREMNLLKSLFEVARKEWGWLVINPLVDVKRPASPPSRKRRISAGEIDLLRIGFGLSDGDAAETSTQRTGLAFLFALETAMRAGEILGLQWRDVRTKSVTLPKTKNGDSREVPLSLRAREILKALPGEVGSVFNLDPQVRDALFRKVRDRCEIADLHFHDSRAEAIWRLSKKLDVMELARMIGHRDLRSLMIYYATSADELADQLG